MFPHQFFDLTPGEVTAWLGPRWRGAIENAYWFAKINRMGRGKKFPKTVDEIFPKKREILAGQEFYDRARAVVKEFNKGAAARGHTEPKIPSRRK